VFKRKNKRTMVQSMQHAVWPKGGWTRAFHYIRHRLRRLPDTPESIARGIFAGVFIAFTPFYGLHFILSAALARIMRGNIFAALIGNFFGNPLTYVPITIVSLKIGHWILGTRFDPNTEHTVAGKFAAAWRDLFDNALTLFTHADPHWLGLMRFWREVFLPYLVGGVVPGLIAASACYFLALPVIRTWQRHRQNRAAKRRAPRPGAS